MFKSYLKIAFRNLLKNKLTSAINILGLAIGIAASITIYLYAHNALSYDAFHQHANSIFLVYKERITPTGTQITHDTWVPMAAELKNEYPDIVNATHFWDTEAWVQVGDQRFQETVAYSDASLFEMFTFPLRKGDPATAFSDLHAAVISPEIAHKYFGEEDPIGKTIIINYATSYTIRGVLAAIPKNSSLEINILARFESLPRYEEQRNNWGGSFLYTFVRLSGQTAAAALEAQLPAFITKIWGEQERQRTNLKLLPLLDLYHQLTGARTYAYVLLCIAGVILLIACINFMKNASLNFDENNLLTIPMEISDFQSEEQAPGDGGFSQRAGATCGRRFVDCLLARARQLAGMVYLCLSGGER